MLKKKYISLFAASLMLANCSSTPDEAGFCQRDTWACLFTGLTAVAIVAVAVGGSDAAYLPAMTSDERLKREINFVDSLENGVKLYSFRYWNDNRTFIGPLAQDLLRDSRYNHAVTRDESGYYKVNLAALGLGIAGDAEQFLEAGRAAVANAKPAVN